MQKFYITEWKKIIALIDDGEAIVHCSMAGPRKLTADKKAKADELTV